MNKEKSNTKRIEWIDISKALLIIFVIMGHTILEFNLNLSFLRKIIYSFHMAAFFMLSGFTNSRSFSIPFGRYLQKKARRIMIPYFVFCLIILSCHIAKQLILHSDNIFFARLLDRKTIVQTVLITYNSIFSNLWFLPAFFVASCLLYAFNILFNNTTTISVISFICGIVAFCIGNKLSMGLPLDLEAALLGIFFIQLGIICKRVYCSRFMTNQIVLVSTIILFAINYVDYFIFDNPVDSFFSVKISNGLFFLLASMCGTSAVAKVSQKIRNNRLLEFIGKNSLLFYGLHFISQNIIGFMPIPNNKNMGVDILLLLFLCGLNIAITASGIIVYKKVLSYFKFRRFI